MGLARFEKYGKKCVEAGGPPFMAMSTGCSCCAVELPDGTKILDAAIKSMMVILEAAEYFKWEPKKLIELAQARRREEKKKNGVG